MTTGYFTNHAAMNVNNFTCAIEFYTQVFGMPHMFHVITA